MGASGGYHSNPGGKTPPIQVDTNEGRNNDEDKLLILYYGNEHYYERRIWYILGRKQTSVVNLSWDANS